ncbi:MAG: sulfotransferase [Chloroflexi bacterium]|nr:sulfotransferase [Chloroflexota bacterium]
MDATETARQQIPQDQFLQIRYEDLCAQPAATFQTVFDFCDLSSRPQFEAILPHFPLHSSNQKWQQELTLSQQQMLNELLYTHLNQYGYGSN